CRSGCLAAIFGVRVAAGQPLLRGAVAAGQPLLQARRRVAARTRARMHAVEQRRSSCRGRSYRTVAWGLHRADVIDWVQWPAMAATLAAAWLVASQRRRRRLAGFAVI